MYQVSVNASNKYEKSKLYNLRDHNENTRGNKIHTKRNRKISRVKFAYNIINRKYFLKKKKIQK